MNLGINFWRNARNYMTGICVANLVFQSRTCKTMYENNAINADSLHGGGLYVLTSCSMLGFDVLPSAPSHTPAGDVHCVHESISSDTSFCFTWFPGIPGGELSILPRRVVILTDPQNELEICWQSPRGRTFLEGSILESSFQPRTEHRCQKALYSSASCRLCCASWWHLRQHVEHHRMNWRWNY